jgi:hypothetical protein
MGLRRVRPVALNRPVNPLLTVTDHCFCIDSGGTIMRHLEILESPQLILYLAGVLVAVAAEYWLKGAF